ncbi:hypothetical protein [Asanoa iriomotensis]|nr:hypothetical protein [Asanoa iriomotensis]
MALQARYRTVVDGGAPAAVSRPPTRLRLCLAGRMAAVGGPVVQIQICRPARALRGRARRWPAGPVVRPVVVFQALCQMVAGLAAGADLTALADLAADRAGAAAPTDLAAADRAGAAAPTDLAAAHPAGAADPAALAVAAGPATPVALADGAVAAYPTRTRPATARAPRERRARVVASAATRRTRTSRAAEPQADRTPALLRAGATAPPTR